MSFIDQTFEHYVQMRHSGMNAKGALEALRDHIESLASNERAELVRRVKSWEGQRSGKGGNETKPRVSAECPRCFEPNPAGELFCAHCGYFLGGDSSQHETTRLSDPEQLERGSDYFGPDSVLVLMLPNNQAFNVQPQRYRHETVIGRAEGSTMRPDIDLSGYNASAQGVSRLHVALQYNPNNHLLSVSDMKSANGTFINGQKLYPSEVRVLRDGDELRLGRFVMRAYFDHSNS